MLDNADGWLRIAIALAAFERAPAGRGEGARLKIPGVRAPGIRFFCLCLSGGGCSLRCVVVVRPCVLAACAAARAGTLNAGRGGQSAPARGGGSYSVCAAAHRATCIVLRLGLVVGSSHARGRTQRASPDDDAPEYFAGLSRRLRHGGHDSNRQQALVSQQRRPTHDTHRRASSLDIGWCGSTALSCHRTWLRRSLSLRRVHPEKLVRRDPVDVEPQISRVGFERDLPSASCERNDRGTSSRRHAQVLVH